MDRVRGDKASVDQVALSGSNKILVDLITVLRYSGVLYKLCTMNLPAHRLHHWVQQDLSSLS